LLQAAGTAAGAPWLPCGHSFRRMAADTRDSDPDHLALSGEAWLGFSSSSPPL
jgi:hypothetical protein